MPLSLISSPMPPSNERAEQHILGELLANNAVHATLRDFLRPECFADPVHVHIYQAISARIEAGQLADAITLRAEFEHSGLLDEVGGTAYLAQLRPGVAGVAISEYGRSVHDAWQRRELIHLGEHLRDLSAEIIQDAFGDTSHAPAGHQANAIRERLTQALAEAERIGNWTGGKARS